jgi:hypothetical protein
VTHPLIEEAMKRAAVAWIGLGDSPARLVWCMSAEGSLWLVTGPGEQALPGIDTATDALVSLRGDHGGRIVTWPATVTRVVPGEQEWSQVVPQLAGKRLNAAPAAELVDRWARECVVTRLTPSGAPVDQLDDLGQ